MRDKSEVTAIQEMTVMLKSRGGFKPVLINDAEDKIGVVTVHDGKTLPQGTIIAPSVGNDPNDQGTYHNNFQESPWFKALTALIVL